MHLILLSGGSGKRLWPLSNDIRSKQFLKVLKDENGQAESMVQRVFRQINTVGGWDSVTVAAGELQKDMISLQLGDEVNIVIEPERRDTFPAIALACSYLASEHRVDRDEIIGVLPVDPYVDIDYFYKIKEISHVFQNDTNTVVDLVLIGAQPTCPTEKYGYIVPQQNQIENFEQQTNRTLGVSYFKEKPSTDLAAQLISKGALWNCGVFGLRLGYVLDIMTNKYQLSGVDYYALRKAYSTLKKTSFDYEVVENASHIKVIPYNDKWVDLGSWETITKEMRNPAEGNVLMENTCYNTHIINELDMPVVAMGIQNSVIVATHDGILVSAKEDTHRLKDMLANIQSRPMYERKRWGKYKVLEASETALTKKLILEPEKSISYQYHNHRKEVWTIISGEGILYLEGEKKRVNTGDVIRINERLKHGIKAITELHIIEVQIGTELIEEDIIRLELDWDQK